MEDAIQVDVSRDCGVTAKGLMEPIKWHVFVQFEWYRGFTTRLKIEAGFFFYPSPFHRKNFYFERIQLWKTM